MEEEKSVGEKREKRKDLIQIVFLIIMIIAIAALIIAVLAVYKYAKMFENPIGYNLAKFNIPYCQYSDSSGIHTINAVNITK